MAINERAKKHYDNAVAWLSAAVQANDLNDAVKYTALGNLSVELAKFCVDNHALVVGIDEDMPIATKQSMGGFKPWGGPALPPHIAAIEHEKSRGGEVTDP